MVRSKSNKLVTILDTDREVILTPLTVMGHTPFNQDMQFFAIKFSFYSKSANSWLKDSSLHVSVFYDAGLSAYSDSVGTGKKCHCKWNVTVTGIFSIRRSFFGPKNCHCSCILHTLHNSEQILSHHLYVISDSCLVNDLFHNGSSRSDV